VLREGERESARAIEIEIEISVNEIWLTNINNINRVIDGEEGAREGGREGETDMLPKELWDKQKRKRWESAMSHQIAKGSGRGSDEDDASDCSSRDELEETGETSAEVETSEESVLWLPESISRRSDRSGVSIRDDCIRWTKDAQPGRHVDSNQTPIAQHQRRSPAEQCVSVCVCM
jgi:hypothetical protein